MSDSADPDPIIKPTRDAAARKALQARSLSWSDDLVEVHYKEELHYSLHSAFR